MAYENLKNAIRQAIKQNGNQEITGNLLQSTLLSTVTELEKDISIKHDAKKAIEFTTADGYQNSKFNGAAIAVNGGWIKGYKNIKRALIVGDFFSPKEQIEIINYANGGQAGALTGVTNILSNDSNINAILNVNKIVEIPDGNILYVSGYNGYELNVYDLSYYEDEITDINDEITDINIKLGNINIKGVNNGNKIVYVNSINMKNVSNVTKSSFTYSYAGKGNKWAYSNIFNPKGSNLIHIKAKVNVKKIGNPTGLIVIASDSIDISGKRVNVGYITEEGEQTIDMTFDPANSAVYQGFTKYCIWINNISMQSEESIEAEFTDFEVYEIDQREEFSNIGGDNASELFKSIDNALDSNITKDEITDNILVSPDGNKYIMSINNEGLITGIKLYPKKAHYFGNSLLAGFGYGMAASASDKDYYYLLNSFFHSINADFTSNKTGASALERLEEANIDSTIEWAINYLAGDEDLVVVQLGDNVNNENIFNKTAHRFLSKIREKCVKARVVWMGMWYSTDNRYNIIRNACYDTGCKFLSFAGIPSDGTRNHVGAIYEFESIKENVQIENVTNVVENSTNNITITFSLGETSYNATFDVTSYSISNTTLTYSGNYGVITSTGVASHPNDVGFKKIANRFLYELGYSDKENYYEL